MKKNCYQILSLILVLVMTIVFLPSSAMAEDSLSGKGTTEYIYKTAETMKPGTYVTTKGYKSVTDSNGNKTTTEYLYKIVIPEDGFVKFNGKAPTYCYGIHILPALSKCDTAIQPDLNAIAGFVFNSDWNTQYLALKKGTYYLYTAIGVKIKYSFYKAGSTWNKSRSKAAKLAPNTKKVICFNKGFEYSRWYKLQLSSRKAITVTLACYDGELNNFSVYDSSGNKISCPNVKGNTFRTAKLPKGTYYIKVHAPSKSYMFERIYSLKWN